MIASQSVPATTEPWPELPWMDWAPTISTLHMWTQVVGKVRMRLTDTVRFYNAPAGFREHLGRTMTTASTASPTSSTCAS
jgi:Family of unknown function (DUF5996)